MKGETKLLRALHPDTNGGDTSHIAELVKVIRQRRENNKVCGRKGCNRKLRPEQARRKPSVYAGSHRPNPPIYCSQHCTTLANAEKRRKPAKLA